MALPELARLAVEKKLSDYCRRKAPPHISDQLRLGFRIRGNSVTLYESRPLFSDPSQWTELVIAQCRFDPNTGEWSLFWADRNYRWHPYRNLSSSRRFETLLKEVDNDPIGIF